MINIPVFLVPHTRHAMVEFELPFVSRSRRFPQSVQNASPAMTDMMARPASLGKCWDLQVLMGEDDFHGMLGFAWLSRPNLRYKPKEVAAEAEAAAAAQGDPSAVWALANTTVGQLYDV